MSATTTEGTGNGSVDNVFPKLINGKVTNENIVNGAVTSEKLADGAITSGKLAANAVGVSNIANASLTVSKMKYFKSSEQTGTGSPQNIAHGLSATPALVMVYPTDLSPATVGQYVVTEGTHTSTNVVVTVTTGKKFRVVAFA